jgi:diguanylate cyclase (GGDEF)-like protein
MGNKDGDLRKNRQFLLFQYALILFFITILTLSWGLTLTHLQRNQTFVLQGIKKNQTNLSYIISKNLFQVLDQSKAISLIASDWLQGRREGHLENIHPFLSKGQVFKRVVLYNQSGNAVFQSSPSGLEPFGREPQNPLLIKFLQSEKTLEFLPKIDSEDGWQVPLLFKMMDASGTAGVMLLELDLGYFLNLFQDIDIGQSGRIIISTGTGRVLVCFENGGLIVSSDAITNGWGVERPVLTTQTQVDSYPFVVTISQAQTEVLADFQAYRRGQIWLLGSISIVFCFVFFLLIQLLKRRRHDLQTLSGACAENQRLMDKLEVEHQNAVSAASFDALTGLHNRRLFTSLAEHNLIQSRRNGLYLAVLFIDLDRFKPINDSLGHRIGDLLLVAIAQRLKGCIRQSDIVSRFGGDEFVIMLTAMTETTKIAMIVETIIEAISLPCELDGHLVAVSSSVGVAIYPRDGETIDSLILNADAAMYGAKKAGRGRYCFFDASLNRISPQQFELEQRVPAAIRDAEFMLHYQPKIRLEDNRVVGFEALVRWNHPEYGLLYPGDFIDRIEESGLIVDLGRWVLECACRQMVSWREQGMLTVPVAINVSPIEMKNQHYFDDFCSVIESFQLTYSDIHIEITESAIIENPQVVKQNLEALAAKGVELALDDFGKGFSSFDHLRTLPLKMLKIDRSFIKDIRNNNSDNAIVMSAISLAKKINLTVIAEGIETRDQLIHLKLAGCDQVQGYFYSRPVPADQVRDFLTHPLRTM